MINQFLEIRQSLDYYGIKQASSASFERHGLLKQNPKEVIFYKAIIGGTGLVEINQASGLTNLFHYAKSNKNICITFKLEWGKGDVKGDVNVRKRIAARLKTTADLARAVCNGCPELESFRVLGEHLERLDLDQFIQALKLGVQEPHAYIGLEVDDSDDSLDFPNSVQSLTFFKALSQRLFELKVSASDEKDWFGNSLEGAKEISQFQIDFSGGRFFYYSRNEDNPCFARFGLNGKTACPIGSVTHNTIVQLVRGILSPENQSYYDKVKKAQIDGLWYTEMEGKGSVLVVSSLMPHDNFLGSGTTSVRMGLQEYKDRCKQLIQGIQKQSAISADTFGYLLVIYRPPNGPCSVRLGQRVNSVALIEKIERWNAGLFNGSNRNGDTLTIGAFRGIVNSRWKREKKQIVKQKKKKDVGEYLSHAEGFQFFLDDASTIQKVVRWFEFAAVPIMLLDPLYDSPYQNYERGRLRAASNLILHKLGFQKEKFMEERAFLLGRLFDIANSLHRLYFKVRGATPPDQLIGHRYIRMAYDNPRRAFDLFCEDFAMYRNWAESAKHGTVGTVLGAYQKIVNKMPALPFLWSTGEKSLLAQGFDYRPWNNETKSEESIEINNQEEV